MEEEEEGGGEEQQQFSYRQRLKAAVHYTVGCLCEEVASDRGMPFSKQTIAAVSELTFRQCETFAKDLEMFARHAKRSTINTEDVKLLARRSNSLHLQEVLEMKKNSLLTFLAGRYQWASQLGAAPFTGGAAGEVAKRQDVPPPQRSLREKAPCKDFFWKTFSSCK
ncbi:PREDICTED: centromere protein S [Odobenus rosmarus divergens]|uniref:Centromere protein S n=1 Tax=Odobenus rosmarus divergens TaxID=9708 RepID=A0A2U3WPT9_ODORO|nr:PREDICTED: centromere protein S [Odobenus rosmarus divergens]